MAIEYNGYEFLKIEKKDKILTLTLNRPESLNRISRAAHGELERVFTEIARDEEVNVVIMTGAGKSFTSGGDIQGFKKMASDPASLNASGRVESARRLIYNFLSVQQPVIAAVNGDALAVGAVLVLMSDIIIASKTARFADGHIRMGLVAGDGGAVAWPLAIGLPKAKEMLLTGRFMTAGEAERLGIVTKVVPPEELSSTALKMAQHLASGPTKALRWTKQSLNKVLLERVNLVLDASLALEGLSMATGDHKRAIEAFLEKKSPVFEGD